MQTGSAYGDHATIREPYNRLQSAVSTLSKGPVAPSDKIGRSDVPLILKSCAADGKLLQGDRPAMTLDSLHHRRAFNDSRKDEVWATSTELDGSKFSVVLGATLSADVAVSLSRDLWLPAGPHVAYEANSTSTVRVTTEGVMLRQCGKWDFQLWAIAPVLGNGWALLGEPSKWVPVSRARFSDLAFSGSGHTALTSVLALGAPGEKIEVAFLAPGASAPTIVPCTIGQGAKVRVSAGKGAMACADV